MKKFLTLLAVAAMATMTLQAAEISPAQALQRYKALMPQSRSAVQEPELAFTVTTEGQNTLYVFNTAKTGFVILSADDAVTPIIGYSDNGAFDPENIPENMSWYLDMIGNEIAQASSTNYLSDAAPARDSIAPLLKTRWNQLAPYNQSIPDFNGKKCPTGCVATALAQIFNYYQYPAQAQGKVEYSYDYGSSPINVKKVLSKFTFDWSNMLNDYTGDYTDEQATAVADLMFATGLAIESYFKPKSTSSNVIRTMSGIVDHMGVDKSMEVCRRTYYTLDDWNDLIYNEIKAGRPVMLGGSNSEGGHEFVADGYKSDNLFHINWGWGGLSNGYFLLTALDPEEQGTGGSSSGYNNKVDAFISLQPDKGSPVKYKMVLNGDFCFNKAKYNRSTGENITVGGDKIMYFNYSVAPIYKLEAGLLLEDINGDKSNTQELITCTRDSLAPNFGYHTYSFSSSKLPEGTWRVSEFWRCEGSSASRFAQELTNHQSYVIKVTPAEVIIEEESAIHDITQSPATVTYYDLQGRQVLNPHRGLFIKKAGNKTTKITR